MITSFDEQLAIDFDIESSIFLQSLAQWTRRNAAHHHHYFEDRYWSYNTYEGLVKIFPYWSKKQLERLIAKCVKHGLVVKGNFNKKKFDKTNWYAMTEKALKYFPFLANLISSQSSEPSPEIGSHTPEIGRPIPKLLNTIRTTTNSELKKSRSSGNSGKSDYLDDCDSEGFGRMEVLDNTGDNPKSDYNKNQTQFCADLSNNSQISGSAEDITPHERKKSISKPRKGEKVELTELINIYREEFPNNPQPHATLIATSLEKTLRTLIKRWPEADPEGKALTKEAFRLYMVALKTFAPKFSLGEYVTKDGNKKKNNMETFCRWNTFVKFLEEQYS